MLDRFEGNMAVLVSKEGQPLVVSRELLTGLNEGDVLTVNNDSIPVLDPNATRERLTKMSSQFSKLVKRKNYITYNERKIQMKTKAVRIYGVNDLRLEEFELPEIADDEILAEVVSDSICMSSHKAAMQGGTHKRVPDDCATNPVIIGHEFCGIIRQVGKKWQNKFAPGEKFSIQPAHNRNGSLNAPGYSYKYCGGDATYVIIPADTLECDCLLKYNGDAFFYGSLAEPMSCVIGGAHANYHTTGGSYVHKMGIKQGGAAAILAGAGPMGLGCIDYLINADLRPSLLIVTDIDGARLARAAEILPVEKAEKNGVKLMYVNTANFDDPIAYMKKFAPEGFDDVFVFAPVRPVVEMGDALLGKDGCLNFFAGPTKTDFSAMFNFYNVHYASTHIVGTSCGSSRSYFRSICCTSWAGPERVTPSAGTISQGN